MSPFLSVNDLANEYLPLTTFEQFFLWEDRPAYPCSCFVRLGFADPLENRALSEAICLALERHPLLTAVVTARRGQLCWVTEGARQPSVVWTDGQAGAESPAAPYLNLFQEPGSRFTVRTDAELRRSELFVQFHHACCDGLGIFQFLEDLLVAYHAFASRPARRPRLAELSADGLSRRGTSGLTRLEFLKIAPRQAIGLIGAKEFLTRSPVPLLPHRATDGDAPPRGFPATLARHFSSAETELLVAKAQRGGVTLNDVLARDLFLALTDFRSRHMADGHTHWLRMMIPMNLRTRLHQGMPAANTVSSVFLDRRGVDMRDPTALLEGIHRQMSRIKRHRLGLTFVFSLHVCRWLPGGLKKQSRRDKCAVSCVFSNLGRVFAGAPVPSEAGELTVGGSKLDLVEFFVPTRPYSCAGFAVLTYANRLSVMLHFDPRAITRGQATELLGLFVGHIQSTV